jgi:heme exporter protein D
VVVASKLLKSSDSFGTVNSFYAFGNYVWVAVLGSFLNLKISGSEETRRKLKTFSFVDDRDVSSNDFF